MVIMGSKSGAIPLLEPTLTQLKTGTQEEATLSYGKEDSQYFQEDSIDSQEASCNPETCTDHHISIVHNATTGGKAGNKGSNSAHH